MPILGPRSRPAFLSTQDASSSQTKPFDFCNEFSSTTHGRVSASSILARRSDLSDAQACGAEGINGLLEVARAKSLKVELVEQGTSADTAGDDSRVVGYGSYALFEA